MLISVKDYFLFLATTTAPAARTATPATTAIPSTPVFVLGFVESPVVGASVAGASVSAGAVVSSSPPPRPETVNSISKDFVGYAPA